MLQRSLRVLRSSGVRSLSSTPLTASSALNAAAAASLAAPRFPEAEVRSRSPAPWGLFAAATAAASFVAACEGEGEGAAAGGGAAEAAAPAEAAEFAVRPKVIFVLGGPGAGKGTQCEKIVKEYGFVHLSAGDLLRAERKSGSADGELIESYIKEGNIVPVEITVRLLEKAMLASGASKFLVDGFPRNEDNLLGWERLMGGKSDVEFVLFYDVDDSTREERLLGRSLTSGRSDDNIETIRKRFKVFRDETMPIVNHYARLGKVRMVSGAPPADEVFCATKTVIDPVVKTEVLETNQKLLNAIHAGDYETYKSLVASDLSAVEDESQGQVVHGLDFHKYYFDGSKAATAGARPAPVSRSEIANPHVRLLSGRSAVVTYTRLVQKPETTDAYAETRVWVEAPKQGWKNVHFHRSRIAAPAGPSSALDLASVASWEELLKSVDDVIKAVDASKPKAP